jgi:hypothetical protein
LNRIYVSLIDAQLRAFASDFRDTARNVFYDENTARLIHPGEFGGFRESLVRDLLLRSLPESYGVSQGFIISPEGDVSSQCDIVVYSRAYAPVIQSPEQQRFFPVESVVAVGEVKSILPRAKLQEACVKLSRVKEMRANLRAPAIGFSVHKTIGPYSAREHLLDQIATFIVADQVQGSLKDIQAAVNNASAPPFRVNIILSIDRWCSSYQDLKGIFWPYPVDVDENNKVVQDILPLVIHTATNDQLSHLRLFLRFMQLLATRTTILYPDLGGYWGM